MNSIFWVMVPFYLLICHPTLVVSDIFNVLLGQEGGNCRTRANDGILAKELTEARILIQAAEACFHNYATDRVARETIASIFGIYPGQNGFAGPVTGQVAIFNDIRGIPAGNCLECLS